LNVQKAEEAMGVIPFHHPTLAFRLFAMIPFVFVQVPLSFLNQNNLAHSITSQVFITTNSPEQSKMKIQMILKSLPMSEAPNYPVNTKPSFAAYQNINGSCGCRFLHYQHLQQNPFKTLSIERACEPLEIKSPTTSEHARTGSSGCHVRSVVNFLTVGIWDESFILASYSPLRPAVLHQSLLECS
jgi:hypothetical protein